MGTVQGGAPAVVSTSMYLGVEEHATHCSALVTLRQVERKGDAYSRNACTRAAELQWPLAARRFLIQRAHTVVAMHLPLVVGTSMAAIRLNSPQGRWAQAIMLG